MNFREVLPAINDLNLSARGKTCGGFCGNASIGSASIRSPEMLRRIGTPRPPGFGAAQKVRRSCFLSIHGSHAAEQSNVSRRKRVHLADSAKGDVLCSPLANPANRPQTRNRLF